MKRSTEERPVTWISCRFDRLFTMAPFLFCLAAVICHGRDVLERERFQCVMNYEGKKVEIT